MSASVKTEESTQQETTEIQSGEVVMFPGTEPVSHTDFINNLKTEAFERTGKALKELATGRGNSYRLNPYNIHVKPDFNSRDFSLEENIQHVEQLALQIARQGVLNPITFFIEDEKVYLEDGECRWRATIIAIEKYGAPIKSIPALRAPAGSEGDRVFAQWVHNNSGKRFTPLEQAKCFQRALGFGYTYEEISQKTGLGVPHIKQIVAFDENTSTEIKEMVREGKISTGLATQVIANAKNQKEAQKVLKTAVKVAATKGKEKATAKDVQGEVGAKLNAKKVLKEIFESAICNKNPKDGRMLISMSVDDYEKCLAALGI
ncbi:unnamed protein product [Sphagnum jensenii]